MVNSRDIAGNAEEEEEAPKTNELLWNNLLCFQPFEKWP